MLPIEFTYVKIPADEALDFEELRGEISKAGDSLQAHLKAAFAGGSIKRVDHLRQTYGRDVESKLDTLNRIAQEEGSVELFALTKPSKSSQPVPHAGVYLYIDEMGMLKDRPVNRRAFELARSCGLEPEQPFHGDAYVGRVVVEPGLRQVDFHAAEVVSSSPWMASAPAENAAYAAAMHDYEQAAKAKQVGPTEEERSKARGWSWSQTAEELEVSVRLPEGVSKKELKVAITATRLVVGRKAGGDPIAQLALYAPVSADESTWTMGSDERGATVCIEMEKLHPETWPQPEKVS
mmetsp:Transcript_19221/g.61330  ORF Transcript_19221/g.61330 Transcript_19221/m.61330 type:complete len:293 (+) Transcript_19221:106-984(+)